MWAAAHTIHLFTRLTTISHSLSLSLLLTILISFTVGYEIEVFSPTSDFIHSTGDFLCKLTVFIGDPLVVDVVLFHPSYASVILANSSDLSNENQRNFRRTITSVPAA